MLSEKKNHSGECKGARVEFKYVDVIPKKGKKKTGKVTKNALQCLLYFQKF